MRHFLRVLLPTGSVQRWVAAGFYRHPFTFVLALLRSVYASWRLTGRIASLPVRISHGQRFVVRRGKGARVHLSGCLYVTPWGYARGPSSIKVGEDATLQMRGDFTIGHNVHISVSKHGLLDIGGVHTSTGSGITCDSRIMAATSISIGADTIIAWGVFITDSDWHQLGGKVLASPIVIGEHVWIAHDCSVLRGALISSGSVVGAKSVVNAKHEETGVLLAGNPAKIVRRDVQWAR